MSEISEALNFYFEKLLKACKEKSGEYPLTLWNEEADSFVYVGEPDDEEWVHWKPVKKIKCHDLSDLETSFNCAFHQDLKDYFNSFWFCELGGFFKEYSIQLEPVFPGIEFEDFEMNLEGYKSVHNNQLDHIPIGFETNQNLLVVVENSTGVVKLEDSETGKFKSLSRNLAALIHEMEVS